MKFVTVTFNTASEGEMQIDGLIEYDDDIELGQDWVRFNWRNGEGALIIPAHNVETIYIYKQ